MTASLAERTAVTKAERRDEVLLIINEAIRTGRSVTEIASRSAATERAIAFAFPSEPGQAHRADVADAALAVLTKENA